MLQMTGCPRTTSTDTAVAALLGGLDTLPPPHILPTHSQCPDPRGMIGWQRKIMIYDHLGSETGRSHLEAEVSAVRPLSKGQTPLCQALPAGYNDDDD